MDKVALVTGGAQGIGRATALLLAARGWEVAVADVRKNSELFFVQADVSRETEVRACVRKVVRRFGRLDGLVNNAALSDAHTGPVERLSLREWNRRIGVNLSGAFLMAKHAAPHLRRAHGAIVNIASTRALQSEPDTEAYAAAKAGLVGLTHALAISLGPQVRVNCISPGWIAPAGAQARPRPASGRPRRARRRRRRAGRLPAIGRRRLHHRAELRRRRRHDEKNDL